MDEDFLGSYQYRSLSQDFDGPLSQGIPYINPKNTMILRGANFLRLSQAHLQCLVTNIS